MVGFGVVTTYAGPVVLDPLFNNFKPLPRGELRADVLRLARQAGVDVGQVYEMDASRRTTAANAYVTGFGRTKRVVLYDTLIDDFTPAETRLVVAHELGHVHHHDVPHGLLWLALVAPFGMWAVAVLAERIGPRDAAARARCRPSRSSLALVVPVLTIVSNQLSRDVERRADAFSLQLTHDPAHVHRLPAADRAQERLRPGPAGRRPLPARHPSEHARADRPGRGLRAVKYTVLAVGRIRPPFADDEAHYRRLLAPHARVELVEVRDDAALARRIPPRTHRVLLDVARPRVRLRRLRALARGAPAGRARRLLRRRRAVGHRARGLRRAALARRR